jgi:hypothetical protein
MALIALFAPVLARAEIASKSYVDSLAAAGGGTIGGLIPWAELRTYADTTESDDPHWGDTWEARISTHMIRGVAACLSTKTKSGNAPDVSLYGGNCWCRVSSVNGIETLGAWVYSLTYSLTDCHSSCAPACSNCVRNGRDNACYRSALFAAP